ncbi:hypothetical protein [Sphingomonas sp. HMP6]|uniref:hypothetical protein n=1 Tax=Sphingomonas sp. HMP6 TaxID=1517551 RepID=UPI001596DCB6|nr:hypothetical protein [Sphingomonas sp. HMP6]BCA57727.1 hypothetical protein HMP06_0496 [Sphingomonas sp. HMP6]
MALRGWKYTPGKPDKRSPAQKIAHQRAFQIFQLRGLYALSYRLTGVRRKAVQLLIDQELALHGAETEGAREAVRAAEREAQHRIDTAALAQRAFFLVDTILTLLDPKRDQIPF